MALEASGSDPKRKDMAIEFLRELGGQNSGRLLLGGLLADLFAEHYSWVASGDHDSPDATTVQTRAESFLARLDVLFNHCVILSKRFRKSTFTGITLEFLSELHFYEYGTGVQTIGIGRGTKAEQTIISC